MLVLLTSLALTACSRPGVPDRGDTTGGERPDEGDTACPDIEPAGPEICGNGVDDDGDGSSAPCLADGAVTMDVAAAAVEIDGPSEFSYLSPAGSTGDLDGDCVDDLLLRYSLDDVPGLAIFAGRSTGLMGITDAIAVVEASTTAGMGGVLADRDYDGDGRPDLVIGLGEEILRMSAPTETFSWFDEATDVITGPDSPGTLLAGGDVDGDGMPDLVAAGQKYDDLPIAVWFGGVPPGQTTSDDADITFTGERLAGVLLAADLDGDGLDEVVIGSDAMQLTDTIESGVLVEEAGARGAFDAIEDAAAILYLPGVEHPSTGDSVGAADVDGDGRVDLVVTADTESFHPTLYIPLTPASGWYSLLDAEIQIPETDEVAFLGVAVTSGDVTGDDTPDLVLGCYGSDDGGRVAVFPGPIRGPFSLDDAVVTYAGDNRSAGLGMTAFVTGDPSGDGVPDLLIGGTSPAIGYGLGVSYLVYGGGL